MIHSSREAARWQTRQRCLLLGACGAGMKALSSILLQAGHGVEGADIAFDAATNPLAAGVTQRPWNDLPARGDFDVCVASPAIPAVAPLTAWARQYSLPTISLHAALNDLFSDRRQVCVAGTHGKSTTTALLSWILRESRRDVGSFCGAALAGTPRKRTETPEPAGHFGTDYVSVLESCEFARSFDLLTPHDILLTGIDRDHFDCFPTDDLEQQAFRGFVANLPADGLLLWRASCERSREVAQSCRARTATWDLGSQSDAVWTGRRNVLTPGRTIVRIRCGTHHFADVESRLYGEHNAANIVAAVAMASHLGVSAFESVRALKHFPGLCRRLEKRGSRDGLIFLDDYAHHPTAVTTTLWAVRQKFPQHRIRVLFEPHQVRRTECLLREFAESLTLADQVIVLPAFPARETVTSAACRQISSRLAATIRQSGGHAEAVDSPEDAILTIENSGLPGDVFLTMGAGQVSQIHDKVDRQLQRHFAA